MVYCARPEQDIVKGGNILPSLIDKLYFSTDNATIGSGAEKRKLRPTRLSKPLHPIFTELIRPREALMTTSHDRLGYWQESYRCFAFRQGRRRWERCYVEFHLNGSDTLQDVRPTNGRSLGL